MSNGFPTILIQGMCVIVMVFLVARLSDDLKKSRANVRRLIELNEGLHRTLKQTTVTLNQTTASLERSSDTVEELLAEKRAAWSIPGRLND